MKVTHKDTMVKVDGLKEREISDNYEGWKKARRMKTEANLTGKGYIETMPQNLKGGTTSQNSGKFAKMFGCDECPWWGTERCPHGVGIATRERSVPHLGIHKGDLVTHHGNKICNERKEYIIDLFPNIQTTQFTKIAQVVNFDMDMEIYKALRRKYVTAVNSGDANVNSKELLDWAKHVADVAAKIRKQDEGIKIENVNPLDKMREVIDVTGADLEELEQLD